MSYAFPKDLAEQVVARWRTFVAKHDRPAPPLPGPDVLSFILETAFFASLAHEEGRDLRFVLCCAPSTKIELDGGGIVPVMPFEAPRPLSIEALRSMAPAVGAMNAAILLTFDAESAARGDVHIAGIVNVGSHLARARTGRSFYHRASPYALLVEVRDAGEVHVYRGGIKLATLRSGRLQDQLAYSGLEFLPVAEVLAAGVDALGSRIRRPRGEPVRESADFEWTALLNTILCIVNGIQGHGHGGTLLLVAPGHEDTLPLRTKFTIASQGQRAVVADRFVEFVNARHELVAANAIVRPLSELEQPQFENATFLAEEDLADAADLVSRLSAVDGALVLRSDLSVLGFGAEIVLGARDPFEAYEVTGHPLRDTNWPAVDSESFGMRHRSALRCVAAATAAAAFVVSQDSTITFMWKQDGRVLMKRNVNTANPNMVGA